MGTASRCAKRLPKVIELDGIEVRCIGLSIPLRQRTCARGLYLGSSQCLYRNLLIERSANVLPTLAVGQQVGFSHESCEKYRENYS